MFLLYRTYAKKWLCNKKKKKKKKETTFILEYKTNRVTNESKNVNFYGITIIQSQFDQTSCKQIYF